MWPGLGMGMGMASVVALPVDLVTHVQMAEFQKFLIEFATGQWLLSEHEISSKGWGWGCWVLLLTVQRYHVLHFRITAAVGLLHGLCNASGWGRRVRALRHLHGTQCGQAARQSAVLQEATSVGILKLDTNE